MNSNMTYISDTAWTDLATFIGQHAELSQVLLPADKTTVRETVRQDTDYVELLGGRFDLWPFGAKDAIDSDRFSAERVFPNASPPKTFAEFLRIDGPAKLMRNIEIAMHTCGVPILNLRGRLADDGPRGYLILCIRKAQDQLFQSDLGRKDREQFDLQMGATCDALLGVKHLCDLFDEYTGNGPYFLN